MKMLMLLLLWTERRMSDIAKPCVVAGLVKVCRVLCFFSFFFFLESRWSGTVSVLAPGG